MKIKKGDKVIVQLGKDKGKVSIVERVLPNMGKILVDKVNVVKKHKKPTQSEKRGGIVEMEKPLNISNVMVLCPNCNKPTRVSYSIQNKSKERVCKKCKGSLDRSDKLTASKKNPTTKNGKNTPTTNGINPSTTLGINPSTKVGIKEKK